MNSFLKDTIITILFGTVSFLLGFAQFPVPGVEGVYSDLREIPLLIAIFHLQHFLFLIPMAFISASQSIFLDDAAVSVTFIFHLVGLFPAWYYYQFLQKSGYSIIIKGIRWSLFVIVYYVVFLIPAFILAQNILKGQNLAFLSSYFIIISNIPFEVIPSALVSSLYFVQIMTQRKLKLANLKLEQTVQERTSELSEANLELKMINQQLIDSNKTISNLNENLESIVNERTEQLNKHLEQLRLYAHSNSHEVRAPLARILGLINLVNMEESLEIKLDLFDKIREAALDLDSIIFKMNKILEEEQLGIDS
jgi:signal transduction histidine kinase